MKSFQCQNVSCLKYQKILLYSQKAHCATCDNIMHIFKSLKCLSIDCGELLPWFWRVLGSKHVGIPFQAHSFLHLDPTRGSQPGSQPRSHMDPTSGSQNRHLDPICGSQNPYLDPTRGSQSRGIQVQKTHV